MSFLISRDELLAAVNHLPPLPRVVQELEAALRNDETRTDAIVRIVSRDAAMTTAALRLANSSFYGVSGRVATLRDAVQVLGLQTLSSAVMTAAVQASFKPADCPGFDFEGCWRHALATALCAQAIAQSRGQDDCVAYTCGLLHDIGTLALASAFPTAFSATLEWAARRDAPPTDAELSLLGLDHAEVGAMVAAHWKFAPVVVHAIGQHHSMAVYAHSSLPDLLHLADNITHALDCAFGPHDMVPPLSLDRWERIGLSSVELQALFERLESRMPDRVVGVAA